MQVNKNILIGISLVIVMIIGVVIGVSISGKDNSVSEGSSNQSVMDQTKEVVNSGPKPTGSVEITTETPAVTGQNSISVDVKVIDASNVNTLDVYRGSVKVASMLLDSEIITVPIELVSGDNSIIFKLTSEGGLETDKLASFTTNLDDVPPRTRKASCSKTGPDQPLFPLEVNEEYLCLRTGQFFGPLNGNAQAPLYGTAIGDFQSITFDGKTVTPEDDGFINQRVTVYLRQGTNIFDVIAVDKYGNESKDRITVEWEEQGEKIDLNIDD